MDNAARLEALLDLTPDVLGMTQAQFTARLLLWEQLAAERPEVTAAQRQAQVRALALGTWIARLLKKADKFRAEGDITMETNILGRIALLQAQELAANTEAGLIATVSCTDPLSVNPAPEFQAWGIE